METVGKHTYGKYQLIYKNDADLRIGAFCSIADGVVFCLGGEHKIRNISTYPFAWLWEETEKYCRTKGDIVVGNDVWLGNGVFVLSGVTIGDGAVVGARSVVARDIEPYTVYAGNPVRKIRDRYPPDVVAALLEIKWWEWPDEKIRENAGLLMSGDIDRFLQLYHRKNTKT